MKKITRFLFCTFVAIMLMGTAISATACHQKEEYPSVPEVTEPQPTGEIIPTVDRQKELKDARKKYADAVAWLYMPGTEVDDPWCRRRTTLTTCKRTRTRTTANGAATTPTVTTV